MCERCAKLNARIAECELLSSSEVTDALALGLIRYEIDLANAEKLELHPEQSGRRPKAR
jgi:hypothetical protein